jgi:hypothetical protein
MSFTENFLLTTKLFCSIPEEQKPINEYIQTKKEIFFNWIFFDSKILNVKLGSFFLFFFISFFLFNSFDTKYLLISTKISKFLDFSLLCFIFFFSIVFYRWFLLKQNFNNARIFYEESSWFDGQFWEKPNFLIKTDHLINETKIKPKLKKTFKIYCFFLFSIILKIFWTFYISILE